MPSGKFRFDKDPQGPHADPGHFQGVSYTQDRDARRAPTNGSKWMSTKPPTNLARKVSQHLIVLQPGTSEMAVSEAILYQGDPKLTYNDAANGTFRFYRAAGS